MPLAIQLSVQRLKLRLIHLTQKQDRIGFIVFNHKHNHKHKRMIGFKFDRIRHTYVPTAPVAAAASVPFSSTVTTLDDKPHRALSLAHQQIS